MKAKISKKVQRILSTPEGRRQLGELIKSGQAGSIDLGNGEIYKFTPDFSNTIAKENFQNK